jgi:hypothetical protein
MKPGSGEFVGAAAGGFAVSKSRPRHGTSMRSTFDSGPVAGKKPRVSTCTPRLRGFELATMRPLASSSESERR